MEQLKEFMSKNNLNQREMATLLNINESMLNRWLNGKTKPSRLWLKEIKSVITAYTHRDGDS